MIKFPSIGQFRNAIHDVRHHDRNAVLQFEGTVKLHGTNGGVVCYPDGSVVTQSRERVLVPGDDNAGFSLFIHTVGLDRIRKIALRMAGEPEGTASTIALYGEWCGGSIQRGIGLNQLDKMFIIFAVKVIEPGIAQEGEDPDDYARWVAVSHDPVVDLLHGTNVFTTTQFPRFKMEIDFAYPELAQNKLVELTERVEQKCPVAAQFGKDGIGEGIVWRCVTPGWESSRYWFKVKGERHQSSKVKTLAEVDVEKIATVKEFVEAVVTENRLQQAISYLQEMKIDLSIKATGDFVRWVHNDVVKEETDRIVASQLDRKDFGNALSTKTRKWFITYLDDLMMKAA